MRVSEPAAATRLPEDTATPRLSHAMGLFPRSCMLLLLLLLMVPAAPVAAQCANTDPCVDQPDCTGCASGDSVPDPDNCRGYYVCTGGSAADYFDLPFDCPDGEVFNADVRECEAGDSCEECSQLSPSCSYECPATGTGIISSFDDCGYYYECDTGDIVGSVACDASTPFFDGTKCQTDKTRCCHCHAFCYSGSSPSVIPDPLDCRRYYLCTNDGMVPTTGGTCSDGQNFDSNLGGCSTATPCHIEAMCINVLGEDGCINPFTCVAEGFFARCPNSCTSEYYHCTEATGEYQEAEMCSNGTVFHTDTHTCVSPLNCP